MANPVFRGDALPVRQVDKIQITAAGAAATIWTVTINNKYVKYTVQSGDTVQLVASSLAALLSSSSVAEFKEISWAVDSTATDTINATGDSTGAPFTITSVVNSGAGTSVLTHPTVPTGPNWWSEPTNWSTGVVPVSTDTVYLQDCTIDIKYGLSQGAVTLAALNIAASYTGKIGLPNFTGPNGYTEYRGKELAISATILNIGAGPGSGSGFIRINLGANQTTLTVYKMASPAFSPSPALVVQGSHANNSAFIYKGQVGFAFFALESAQFPTINVGSVDNPASDSVVNIGTGMATVTTLNQVGGDVTSNVAVGTWTKSAGTGTILGTATITTLTCDGPGIFHWDSNGTITTCTIRSGSQLDNTRDDRAKTLNASSFLAGGYFTFGFRNVVFTTPALIDDKSLPNCVYGKGQYHVTFAA